MPRKLETPGSIVQSSSRRAAMRRDAGMPDSSETWFPSTRRLRRMHGWRDVSAYSLPLSRLIRPDFLGGDCSIANKKSCCVSLCSIFHGPTVMAFLSIQVAFSDVLKAFFPEACWLKPVDRWLRRIKNRQEHSYTSRWLLSHCYS